jgi:hypothetical protein
MGLNGLKPNLLVILAPTRLSKPPIMKQSFFGGGHVPTHIIFTFQLSQLSLNNFYTTSCAGANYNHATMLFLLVIFTLTKSIL